MRIEHTPHSTALQPTKQSIAKVKAKRPKRRFRHVPWFSLTLVMYGLILGGLGTRMIHQYQKTQKWHFNQISGHMNTIPPEFAKNVYSVDMANALEKLDAVDQALQTYQDHHGFDPDDLPQAKRALAISHHVLKRYQITGGQSYQNQQHLKLDLAIYQFQQQAYHKPQPHRLAALLNQVIQRQANHHTSGDQAVIKQLNVINTNYQALNTFLNVTFNTLGTIKGHRLIIKANVDQTTIDRLLAVIKKQNLTRFPAILHLQLLMFNQQTKAVLLNNQAIVQRQKWQRILTALLQIKASEYLSPKQIKTLADAQNAHLVISAPNHPDNLAVKDDSSIKKLLYQNKPLTDGQYFKRGLDITAVIDPDYKVVALPDDTTNGSSDTSDTSKTSSDTSDTSKTSSKTKGSSDTSDKSNESRDTNEKSTESDDQSKTNATTNSTSSSKASSANNNDQQNQTPPN